MREKLKWMFTELRKSLYRLRLFLVYYYIITAMIVIIKYTLGNVDIYALLITLALSLIFILLPYAYGIKEDDSTC